MSFTLTSSAAIIMKAGENADSTATASGALLKEFADQGEAIICAATRYDWVANYSSVGTNFKKILDSAVSAWAANQVVKWNPFSYFSMTEAQTILNVNYDDFNSNLNLLKDAEVRRALGVS